MGLVQENQPGWNSTANQFSCIKPPCGLVHTTKEFWIWVDEKGKSNCGKGWVSCMYKWICWEHTFSLFGIIFLFAPSQEVLQWTKKAYSYQVFFLVVLIQIFEVRLINFLDTNMNFYPLFWHLKGFRILFSSLSLPALHIFHMLIFP